MDKFREHCYQEIIIQYQLIIDICEQIPKGKDQERRKAFHKAKIQAMVDLLDYYTKESANG